MIENCQILVLQKLDFVPLLSIAETNNHFNALVSDMLEKMFRKKMVFIVLSTASGKIGKHHTRISDNYVAVEHFAVAKKLLTKFCHLIQTLIIDRYHSTMDNSTKIARQYALFKNIE